LVVLGEQTTINVLSVGEWFAWFNKMKLLNRICQSLWLNRLKQVIKSIYFKGLQRVLVISRSKNYVRRFFQSRQHVEARSSRHLNIQENQIRILRFNLCNAFFSIGSFIHHLYFRKIL